MKVKPYEYEGVTKHLIEYEVGDRVWCAIFRQDHLGSLEAELELWNVTEVSPGPRGSFLKIPAFRTGLWVGVDGRPDDTRYEKYGLCPEGGWPDGSQAKLWRVSAWKSQGHGRGSDHFGTVFVQANDEEAARERGLGQMPRVTYIHRSPDGEAYHRTTVTVHEIARLPQD